MQYSIVHAEGACSEFAGVERGKPFLYELVVMVKDRLKRVASM